jgi:hypothetical protein
VAGSGGVECLAMLMTGLGRQGGLIVTKLETRAMQLSNGRPYMHRSVWGAESQEAYVGSNEHLSAVQCLA